MSSISYIMTEIEDTVPNLPDRQIDVNAIGRMALCAHLHPMRPLLFTAVLCLAATPALAYCPSIPDDATTGYVGNQTQLTLCRANELHDRTALKAQELHFQADLQAQTKMLELQFKLQQTYAAAQPPVFVMPKL